MALLRFWGMFSDSDRLCIHPAERSISAQLLGTPEAGRRDKDEPPQEAKADSPALQGGVRFTKDRVPRARHTRLCESSPTK